MLEKVSEEMFIKTCVKIIKSDVGGGSVNATHTYVYFNHDQGLFLELAPMDGINFMRFYAESFNKEYSIEKFNMPYVLRRILKV